MSGCHLVSFPIVQNIRVSFSDSLKKKEWLSLVLLSFPIVQKMRFLFSDFQNLNFFKITFLLIHRYLIEESHYTVMPTLISFLT